MTFYIHCLRFFYAKKYIFFLLVSCLGAIGFTSCGSTKNTYYFKTLPSDTSLNTSNRLAESKIRKHDLLAINISSLNPVEDAVYNAAAMSSGGAKAGVGYLVDVDGNIQLHRLGVLQVEGMTRRELKNKIENDIKPYLKDPVVTVTYLNHQVTLMGEIGSPQVMPMPEEQLSILDVLAGSGDLKPTARADNILVIRETETGKQFKRINLEDHSIFNSEWFYMQPGDVVYVEPSDKKLKDERRTRLQQNVSLAISGISFAIIILDRIFR